MISRTDVNPRPGSKPHSITKTKQINFPIKRSNPTRQLNIPAQTTQKDCNNLPVMPRKLSSEAECSNATSVQPQDKAPLRFKENARKHPKEDPPTIVPTQTHRESNPKTKTNSIPAQHKEHAPLEYHTQYPAKQNIAKEQHATRDPHPIQSSSQDMTHMPPHHKDSATDLLARSKSGSSVSSLNRRRNTQQKASTNATKMQPNPSNHPIIRSSVTDDPHLAQLDKVRSKQEFPRAIQTKDPLLPLFPASQDLDPQAFPSTLISDGQSSLPRITDYQNQSHRPVLDRKYTPIVTHPVAKRSIESIPSNRSLIKNSIDMQKPASIVFKEGLSSRQSSRGSSRPFRIQASLTDQDNQSQQCEPSKKSQQSALLTHYHKPAPMRSLSTQSTRPSTARTLEGLHRGFLLLRS